MALTQVQGGMLTSGGVAQINLGTNVAGNGPAFSVYANAVTATANNSFTKIAFQVEEYDTNSNFDSTTNYRFTPTVSGYYQISAGLQFAADPDGGVAVIIYKNGTAYRTGSFYPNGNISPIATVSSLVYFNGSTDYVEIYGYQASGGTLNTVAGIQFTWFTGAMVRAA
jgi:hypothetical protein